MATTTEPTPTRMRRSPEDWEQVARECRPRLQGGETVSQLAKEFGTNTYALQVGLARVGSDPKGKDLRLRPITGSRPQTLARRIADARKRGEPFWQIEAEVEPRKSYREIKALLREHGFGEFASGRMSRNGSSASNGDAPTSD